VLISFTQVFRKYSFSVGPKVVQLLEEILDRHDILDEDVESSLETLAKEYTKQEGAYLTI
jgi:DNA polymerase epsilon subunit 2